MKPSTVALSFLGFCVFYICNGDWMDQIYETLIEEYLGADYEEVAPFVSSVTAGADEFDQIIEHLANSKPKWYQSSVVLSFLAATLAFLGVLYQVLILYKGRCLLDVSRQLFGYFWLSVNALVKAGGKIQKLSMEFAEGNETTKQLAAAGDDVPVKLLWKGGSLVESSIHCNVRENSVESKILHMQKQLLQSKLLVKCGDMGGGDETAVTSQISPVPSNESTAIRMAEIRKLLESEPEIMRAFVDGEDGEEWPVRTKTMAAADVSCRRIACRRAQKSTLSGDIAEENGSDGCTIGEIEYKSTGNYSSADGKSSQADVEIKRKQSLDWDGISDPKIMNRIRLLESRLRLEELKNKNWINRMSRAEGILQQLNKQVERIEETRPLETRTETLKITSTVTNWASSSAHPRRNNQFTLVNQPFYLEPPCLSLSEVIKKEIGIPSAEETKKSLYPRTPKTPIPALSTTGPLPQSSFFSKFLSR